MTYLNPVYRDNFPDPFVLKYAGEYWAYCTGVWRDGRWFGVLRSRDLVTWEELGGALEPLPGSWPCQWAPELLCAEGRLFLYYSLGDETTMHLRVAVAAHPAGPFVDSGRRLTREPFAIDPHVFTDDDGARYLFYATDFLSHTHIGTGTVRDRLLDPLTPEGRPVPVTRARYDWQVYDPQRAEKGGVRWHTVEGPFVLKRKGRYAQMFSAGNWQNPTYGVSFASSARIDTPEEWQQAADGQRVLPIMRTLPGLVAGPGHNSVVRGPDNLQLYAVYHRWDGGARTMAIDPLEWVGDRLVVLGPSATTRPAPLRPAVEGGRVVHGSPRGRADVRFDLSGLAFVCEVSLRRARGEGCCGLGLRDQQGRELLRVLIWPGRLRVSGPDGAELADVALPPDPPDPAPHLLRLCVDGLRASVALDPPLAQWRGRLERAPAELALQTERCAAEFAGFALTHAWEDLFEQPGADPAELGWHGPGWQVAEGALRCAAGPEPALVCKGPLPAAYELVVNVRVGAAGGCGFCPALDQHGFGPQLLLAPTPDGWALRHDTPAGPTLLALPELFDPAVFQHFRFRVVGGQMSVAWEARELGVLAAPDDPQTVGLLGFAGTAVELVRLTELV